MILADKIMELRKKNGWSQEELAERLNVSRQSVSKWEGAQSVPDMNKLLALSDIFGVSTDYLLRDELGEEYMLQEQRTEEDPSESIPIRKVSMEEANAFLADKAVAAPQFALAVMLCILSPVPVILLAGLTEHSPLAFWESQMGGLGIILLLLCVGSAVAMFVMNGLKLQKYGYLEREVIETAYGVSGMVRERQERFRSAYVGHLTVGIVLCVIAAIPIFVAVVLWDGGKWEGQAMVIAVAIVLILIAVGVFLLVRAGIRWETFQILLEEGDYSRKKKTEKEEYYMISHSVFWPLVTAVYLIWSFATGDWHFTWVIWPVAPLLHTVLIGLWRMLRGA